jgi:hypothetical protein
MSGYGASMAQRQRVLQRDLRKRRRCLATDRPAPRPPLTFQTGASGFTVMRVRYSAAMTGRAIDRSAWASVVRDLVRDLDGGNKSAFARRVGYTTKTIDRWLAGAVDVSEGAIRQVAERCKRNPVELLVTIGYYRPDELALSASERPTYPDPREDPVIQKIMADPRLTEDQRADLVQVQLDLIEADVKRRQAEYDRLMGYQERRDAS